MLCQNRLVTIERVARSCSGAALAFLGLQVMGNGGRIFLGVYGLGAVVEGLASCGIRVSDESDALFEVEHDVLGVHEVDIAYGDLAVLCGEQQDVIALDAWLLREREVDAAAVFEDESVKAVLCRIVCVTCRFDAQTYDVTARLVLHLHGRIAGTDDREVRAGDS